MGHLEVLGSAKREARATRLAVDCAMKRAQTFYALTPDDLFLSA